MKERASTRRSPEQQTLRDVALTASTSKGWLVAVDAWSNVLKSEPEDLEGITKLSEALLRLRDFVAARAMLERGLALAPQSFSLRLLNARAHDGRGNSAAEIDAWQQVLEVRPRHFESHLKLAASYQDTGEFGAARRHIDEAEALSPDNQETDPVLLRQSLAEQNPGEALRAYRLRVKHKGKPPAPSLDLAALLLKAGAPAEARTVLGTLPTDAADSLRWASIGIEIAMQLRDWPEVVKATRVSIRGVARRDARARLWASLVALHAEPSIRGAAVSLLAKSLRPHAQQLVRAARRADLPHLEAELQNLAGPAPLNIEEALREIDLLLQRQCADIAEELATALVSTHRDEPRALLALARTQAARASWAAAIATRRRLSELMPQDSENLLALAGLQARGGMLGAAEQTLMRCLQSKPVLPEVLRELGVLAARTGRLARARALFHQALRIAPEDGDTLNRLGLVCEALDLQKEAIEAFTRCLAVIPWHVPAWSRLRVLEGDSGDTEWAAHLTLMAARAAHSPREPHFLAAALMEADDTSGARAALDAALEAFPRNASLLRLHAIFERVLGAPDAALPAIERAIAVAPDDSRLRDEKLMVLCASGDYPGARAYVAQHERYFASPPVLRRGVGLLAPLHLAFGEYREAFAMYRHGDTAAALRASLGKARSASQMGSLRRGERLLVLPGWGIGDEVNWSQIYPEIAARHPTTVFGADPRLLPLFQRSFPELSFTAVARWHGREDPLPVSAGCTYAGLPDLAMAAIMDGTTWHLAQSFDRVALATDLLPDFRGERAAFPQQAAYLRPDEAAVCAWRQRLAALGPGRKIGIAWTSSFDTPLRRAHTTRLDDWRAVFDLPDVQFVSVQVDGAAQLATRPHLPVHRLDGLDLRNDIDGTAALLAALDAVIAIINSTGELAGAVGARTILLNRSHALDWRIADSSGTDLLHPTAIHVRPTSLTAQVQQLPGSPANPRASALQRSAASTAQGSAL